MRKAVGVMGAICLLLLASCGSAGAQSESQAEEAGRKTGSGQAVEALAEANWKDQYDLGVRYLSEGNYKEAIIAFTAAISIEPREIAPYEGLGDAYFGSGDPAAAAPYYEYVYAVQPENQVVSKLFLSEVASDNFDALERSIDDVQMGSELLDSLMTDVLEYIFENENKEAAERLAEVIKDSDELSATELCLILWPMCEDQQIDDINQLLAEQYKELPRPKPGDILYAGGRDEEGQPDGFGLCLFGEGIWSDTVMYIGEWSHGKRTGEGTAYSGGENYITCTWADDLPNGEMTLHRSYGGGQVTYGVLKNGHVAAPTHSYTLSGEWVRDDCMEDASQASGYRYVSVENPDGGLCPCVGNHRFCWDCEVKEGA